VDASLIHRKLVSFPQVKEHEVLGTVVAAEGRGILRNIRAIMFALGALLLVGAIALAELPRQSDATQSKLLTARELFAAYEHIQPGRTRASQLARYGLDTAAANTQVLSYLGVMEHFMARDSVTFDRLDAGVRHCIEARDRCTALVFRAADRASAATPTSFLSTFGMGASAAADTPRVTLLIRNGRVAFKMMSPFAALEGIRSARMQTPSQNMGAVAIAIRPNE
jgi:hypothetical protein